MKDETKETGMKAVEYVGLYNNIRGMVGDREVALAILHEMAKDIRCNQIRHERRQRDKGPATERQKAYLRKLGVEFGSDITCGPASKLIDEELERRE